MNQTIEAGSRVNLAVRKFSAWLSSITIPYAMAWRAHRAALEAADQAAKNADALVMGTVLAFIPGGMGGAVGKAMKKLGAGDALVDGVKDLVKYGLREGGRNMSQPNSGPRGARTDASGARTTIDVEESTSFVPGASSTTQLNSGPQGAKADATGAQIVGGTNFKALPADPLVWQNQTNLRVEKELLIPATECVLEWQHSINSHDPGFDPNFDPIAAVNKSLKFDGISLFHLEPQDSELLLKSYEQGFLMDWIKSEYFRVFSKISIFSAGFAQEPLLAYGESIGLNNVRELMSAAYSSGQEERRRRMFQRGYIQW